MSFYSKSLPNPYDPGYALPEYVRAEPPGRGAFTTDWLPRGTISEVIPDFLAKPSTPKTSLSKSSLSGHSLAGHSLSGSSLGNVREGEAVNNASEGRAVLAQFGDKAAGEVLAAIASLPPSERGQALSAILKEIRPGLLEETNRKTAAHQRVGKNQQAALRAALSEALAEGLVKDLLDLGTGKKKQPRMLTLPSRARALSAKPVGLGFIGGITDAIGSSVKKAVGGVASLTCSVVNNPATGLAAAGAATAYGAPPQAGVAGAQMAQGICGGGATAQPGVVYAPQPSTPDWLLPVAIGGGALVLILALR